MTPNTQENNTEHMHDLSIKMHDGLWRLEQSDGCEQSIIDLHPMQVRWLAEYTGLLAAPTIPVIGLNASHIRKIHALFERTKELYLDDSLNNEIIKYCGNGFEIVAHLRAIYEQAEELAAEVADIEAGSKSATSSHLKKGANCDN